MKINHLTKVIHGKKIIGDISFELNPGEITGFIGPNGAGKTTTIKMITGLMKISTGDITIGEISIKNNRKGFLEKIGAIVENPEFYKYLTGYQNLNILSKICGKTSKEEILNIVERVQLSERIHDKVGCYSLGMKQRLGIAQSLLHNPQFLILDEPTNGLDPQGVIDLRNNLLVLAKEYGISILISSHQLHELDLICDQFIFIKEGRIEKIHIKNNHSNQLSRFLIKVSPLQSALEALLRDFPDINARLVDDKISLSVLENRIPEVMQSLTKQEFRVYGIEETAKFEIEELYQSIQNG